MTALENLALACASCSLPMYEPRLASENRNAHATALLHVLAREDLVGRKSPCLTEPGNHLATVLCAAGQVDLLLLLA